MNLYQIQDMILEAFYSSSEFPFVLSGETALSRYYLHHRESEDLDFFCKSCRKRFLRQDKSGKLVVH